MRSYFAVILLDPPFHYKRYTYMVDRNLDDPPSSILATAERELDGVVINVFKMDPVGFEEGLKTGDFLITTTGKLVFSGSDHD